MQNLSLELISLINHANEVFIDLKLLADLDRSIKATATQTEYASEAEKLHAQDKLLTLKLTRATVFENRIGKRIDLQHEALSKLKELDYLLTVAVEHQVLLHKQREQAAALVWETRKLLGAWIKSDRQRYNY